MNEVVNERAAVVDVVRNLGYFDRGIAAHRALLKGARVLELGLNGNPWGIAALEAAGAEFYAGVDPLNGTKRVRDFRSLADKSYPDYTDFPYSSEDLMRLFPNLKLYAGTLEENVQNLRGLKLNVAFLSGILQRLRDPLNTLHLISDVLERDGTLWINHANYYSWAGHGLSPRHPRDFDESNAEHRRNADWKHLDPHHPAWSSDTDNRIRLRDLRDIVSKYFEIVDWSPTVEAVGRLTPHLRMKFKKYSLADLTFQSVYIIAKKRNIATWKVFADRELFHPGENYRAKEDHSRENNGKYSLVHHVLFSEDGRLFSHSDNEYAGGKVIARFKPGQKIRLLKGKVRLNLTVKEVTTDSGGQPSATFVETIDERYLTDDRQNWRVEIPELNLEP